MYEKPANVVHVWRMKGHGLVSLAKHISDLLNIELSYYERGVDLETFKSRNAVIFTRDLSATLQTQLKMFGRKYLVLVAVCDDERAEFEMPLIESRQHLEDIILNTINCCLDEFDGIEDIKYPFAFSRLFRLKKSTD